VRSAGKRILGHAPPLVGSKNTISRFGKRFRDGQYSFVSFLFAVLLVVIPVPSHLESALLNLLKINGRAIV